MKLKKLIITAVLALAGVGWGLPSAHALVWNSNDLLIGFRATGGDGQSTSYLVNIGQASQFLSSGAPITLSLGDVGADLASLYGSEWYNRSDLYWSVFGRASNNLTLYGSKEREDVGVQSTPWNALSSGNGTLQGTGGKIQSVTDAFSAGASSPAAPVLTTGLVATNAGKQANVGNDASYNYELTNYGTAFGSLSQWGSEFQGNFGDGVDGTVLDLYRFTNGTVAYRGYFSISESGVISFNDPAAVPEPSTYALMAIAGTLFFVFLRRRQPASAVA